MKALPLPALISLTVALAALPVPAAETGKLIPQLEGFRPFLGKTWRGEMKNSTPEKPVVDVARWERALNGTAVRTTHSINAGSYGGETLIFWDESKKSLAYFYFTTGGFYTRGTMTVKDGKYTSHELVSGPASGVTEVKGTGEIRPDGSMTTHSEYLKNGTWVPGHSATYVEDAKATVVFK